jgi:hypothetical protein
MMSGWQPDRYDPQQHQQYMPQQQYEGHDPRSRPHVQTVRKTALTAAEKFWYVVGNIALGAMYFAKIPAKKALADFGLAELTTAEGFWYILMCIPFGAGYFAKIPTAKAISELSQFRTARAPTAGLQPLADEPPVLKPASQEPDLCTRRCRTP